MGDSRSLQVRQRSELRCGVIRLRVGSALPRWAVGACAAVALLGAATVPGSGAHAGSVFLPSAGTIPSVSVLSIKEARFKHVVKQQYDFSCGSAALATLLTYHYEIPKTEEQVFFSMFDVGDRERIQREGFSLADMQKYLQSIGLRANGFNVELKQLADAAIPAITLINTNGYRHFVVIKGIRDGNVLVGDPALGVNEYTVADFQEIWVPIAFIIEEKIETAQAHYGQDEDWATVVRSPIGSALSPRDLGTFTINLPAFNEF